MAHASRISRPSSFSARALALAAGLASATSAVAGDERELAPDEQVAPQVWIDAVPTRCAMFATLSGRPTSEAEWRQLLSLAACVQDGSIGAASTSDQLAPMVEELSERLTLPMLIYLDALEHAEAPIQLRAAFQIGMAYVGLSTRARSSIAAPPDLATNPAAARRYRELHARLEPLLVPARQAAWISFRVIDEAAAVDPSLAGDEVERHMVATARRMLQAMGDVMEGDDSLLVRRRPAPPARAGAPVTAAAR